jgi:hypothetical protein
VPVGDQLLDVEEVGVEGARRDGGDSVAGQDPQAAVDLEGVKRDPLAPRGWPHARGVPSGRRLGDLDHVAGDERDAV